MHIHMSMCIRHVQPSTTRKIDANDAANAANAANANAANTTNAANATNATAAAGCRTTAGSWLCTTAAVRRTGCGLGLASATPATSRTSATNENNVCDAVL